MGPPTRITGREELRATGRGAGGSLSYENVLRASGVHGVMTRPLDSAEEETTLFGSVLMPLEFSLDGSLRKAAWLADRAYGVVITRMGLAVRVQTGDFEDIVKLVQPENYSKFLGRTVGRV